MTKITLEDLKTDFERARYAFIEENHCPSIYTRQRREIAIPGFWTKTQLDSILAEPRYVDFRIAMQLTDYAHLNSAKALIRAATVYNIARDEGLEAAMLWKLANA